MLAVIPLSEGDEDAQAAVAQTLVLVGGVVTAHGQAGNVAAQPGPYQGAEAVAVGS
jgi:hypothetical protein